VVVEVGVHVDGDVVVDVDGILLLVIRRGANQNKITVLRICTLTLSIAGSRLKDEIAGPVACDLQPEQSYQGMPPE